MAESRDRLSALPNELYNQVLSHLDLLSIKNLRCASQPLATKCLGPSFLAYYEEQETDLTPTSLHRLCELTAHPILGPAVKRLTVVAVFHNPSSLLLRIRRLRDPLGTWSAALLQVPSARNKELLEKIGQLYKIMSIRHEQQGQFSDDIVGSLSHILANLGSLDHLKLTARVLRPDLDQADQSNTIRGVNWNCLWADCHRLLKIVTSAMSTSRANVETFSIFNDCFGKVQVSDILTSNFDFSATL
jgi:hypothetical protein